jgi:mannonate dehydratase
MRFAEMIVESQPTAFWRQLGQIGVEDAVIALPRGFQDWRQGRIDQPWSYNSIALYQELLAEENLRVAVIEDNPPMDEIRYGRPGREEELEQVVTLLRAMGRLGITTWCYNWIASLGWIRTQMALRGRGGALVAGYDHALLDHRESSLHGPIGSGPLWDNLIWFLERVLPVAEEAGVRLALHPDDPPVAEVRGIARVMHDGPAYARLFERLPSPANAMTFCQGNLALTSGDLPALIREFGDADRIAFVHFRDVRGTPERFVETFHDEGQTDMLACMRAYHEVGYTGVMRSDHVPLLAGDTQRTPGYSDQGRLFAIGYMTGLREAARAAPN